MSGESWKEFLRGRKERRPKALSIWQNRGPLLVLQYERIKQQPLLAAKWIAEFSGHGLDPERMVDALRNRETGLHDGMLEEELRREGPPDSALDNSATYGPR